MAGVPGKALQGADGGKKEESGVEFICLAGSFLCLAGGVFFASRAVPQSA